MCVAVQGAMMCVCLLGSYDVCVAVQGAMMCVCGCSGGYEEVSGGQDLTKVAYAGVQQQAKVAAAAAVASRMSTR